MDLDGFDQNLLPLLVDLYDAAVEPGKWASLAPKIASAFDAESCVLQQRGLGRVSRLCTTDNYSAAFNAGYVAQYKDWDEWSKRALPRPPDMPTLGEELISLSEIERLPFYDLLRQLGVFHLLGAVVSVGQSSTAIIGLHRENAAFDEASKRRLALVIPHLRRALQLERELAKQSLQRQAALQGLDRSMTAMILVDHDGRVLFANEPAILLLREGDGLAERGGRLQAQTESVTSALLGLIAVAANTGAGHGSDPGSAIALPRRMRRPLTGLVCPMRPEAFGKITGASDGLVVLFIRDPVQPRAAGPEALRSLFGLTAAEARLAAALAAGDSVEQFAAAHNLSTHTVRTLLKRVMNKTSTNRQGELIALALRSSAALSSEE